MSNLLQYQGLLVITIANMLFSILIGTAASIVITKRKNSHQIYNMMAWTKFGCHFLSRILHELNFVYGNLDNLMILNVDSKRSMTIFILCRT